MTNKQAFRVALRHLESQVAPPAAPAAPTDPRADKIDPSKDPKEMPNYLTDKQILVTAEEAINSYHQALIMSYLKQIPVEQLFVISSLIVKKFNDSGVPMKEFEALFNTMKPKVLRVVRDLILSDKKSIKDTILQYFMKKENQTEDEDEVDTYAHDFLAELRRDAQIFHRKLNQLLE